MTIDISSVRRSEVFRKILPPFKDEAKERLEANILGDGRVLEKPTVWFDPDGTPLLVDGYHRMEIYEKHKDELPPPEFEVLDGCETIPDVCVWLVQHHLGRRNLTPKELSRYRAYRYEQKKRKMWRRSKTLEHQNDALAEPTQVDTAQEVAEETGVSRATVQRDARKLSAEEALNKLMAEFPVWAERMRKFPKTRPKPNELILVSKMADKKDREKAVKNWNHGRPFDWSPEAEEPEPEREKPKPKAAKPVRDPVFEHANLAGQHLGHLQGKIKHMDAAGNEKGLKCPCVPENALIAIYKYIQAMKKIFAQWEKIRLEKEAAQCKSAPTP